MKRVRLGKLDAWLAGPLGADLIQDCLQVFHVRLPRRQRVQHHRVRGTRPAPVEQDQPRERRQRAEEQSEPGILPGDIDLAEEAEAHYQVGRPVTEHMVGDPIGSQPRVLGLRLHCPSGPSDPDQILSATGVGVRTLA